MGFGFIVLFVSALKRAKADAEGADGEIIISDMGDEYEGTRDLFEEETLDKHALKALHKERKQKEKADRKKTSSNEASDKRVFVVDFDGDLEASDVASLRECITAIVMTAKNDDEVVILLESSGGYIQNYGYAASQLERLRRRDIPCTVCIDMMAASGGYLMAAVANTIHAAPFAIVGSIGVVSEMPNFNRLLRNYDIDYELHTAGDHKSTLTMWGENTDKGRAKFQEELDQSHDLFKRFIAEYRSQVNIDKIATGEYWHAKQALGMGLVDSIQSSDDYLLQLWQDGNSLYKVQFVEKKSFFDKFSAHLDGVFGKILKARFIR